MKNKKIRRAKPVEIDDDFQSRKKILMTSLQLFSEKGFDGTTTREISSKSKTNISLISYYFGGKDGLYKAVFEYFLDEAMKELKELLLLTNNEPLTKDRFIFFFRELVSRILRQRRDHRAFTVLMQREIAARLERSREVHEQMTQDLGAQVLQVFEFAQKKGILKKDLNLHGLMFSIVHVIDGYFMISSCKTTWVKKAFDLENDPESFCDHVVKLFLHGSLK